jgi:uncharacterized membrane-anchored protein
MPFKINPKVGPRYWSAILIASMCGANLGDIIPDVLKMSAWAGLTMLALMFALVVAVERLIDRGSEVFYWISILIVRAAATNIADYLIEKRHLTSLEVISALALVIFAILILHHRSYRSSTNNSLPSPDGLYWMTMLVAGSLGTVMADAIGHSFPSVKIGVPVSAAIASLTLAIIWTSRAKMAWLSTSSYWITVVGVRWWGTNVGDIAAFLITLLASAASTGLALAALLLVTRAAPPRSIEKIRESRS